jgi:hypothetical protein
VPPDWEPDTDRAFARVFETQRVSMARRRALVWIGILSMLLVAGFAAFPPTRTLAERMWREFSQTKVDVVRIKAPYEPPPDMTFRPPAMRPAADAAEAAALAGFTPNLPASPIEGLSALDGLSVREGAIQPMTIRVADLTAGLQRTGISTTDVRVPSEWDGVVIQQKSGPSIFARYGSTMFIQTAPIVLIAPDRFPLDAFIEVLLRINGLSASEARDRRNRFAANPALLMFLPSDFKAEVREFSGPSGHGLLVFNGDGQTQRCGFCPRPGETLMAWSSPERMYNLMGPLTPEQAIAFANSVK